MADKATGHSHKSRARLVRENLRIARQLTEEKLSPRLRLSLRSLSREFGLSLRTVDLQLLQNFWYVTHAGLLPLARWNYAPGRHSLGCDNVAQLNLCPETGSRFIPKIEVCFN